MARYRKSGAPALNRIAGGEHSSAGMAQPKGYNCFTPKNKPSRIWLNKKARARAKKRYIKLMREDLGIPMRDITISRMKQFVIMNKFIPFW